MGCKLNYYPFILLQLDAVQGLQTRPVHRFGALHASLCQLGALQTLPCGGDLVFDPTIPKLKYSSYRLVPSNTMCATTTMGTTTVRGATTVMRGTIATRDRNNGGACSNVEVHEL